jgi:hypothetical protein
MMELEKRAQNIHLIGFSSTLAIWEHEVEVNDDCAINIASKHNPAIQGDQRACKCGCSG